MAIAINGKSKCVVCGTVVDDVSSAIGFPAFIPKGHRFSAFSDSVFHRSCFEQWNEHGSLQSLYEAYRSIWESRPKLASLEEVEAWGKNAFKGIFNEGMLNGNESVSTQSGDTKSPSSSQDA